MLRPLALSLAATTLLAGCTIRPEPLPEATLRARAEAQRAALAVAEVPLTGPLSLEEAIARALLFNQEQRLAQMEQALQVQQLTLASFNLLPRLTADAGYSVRSNEFASSSESVITRRQSLEPSTSRDEDIFAADLTLTWSILDFGLSYYQARQQADRVLVALERRRKVVNNLVGEVRTAWFQAAAAERLLPRIDPILADAERALANADIIEREQLRPLVETLEYRRTLLELVGQLRQLRGELAASRIRLAALVGLPPGGAYSVATPPETVPTLPDTPIATLESYGLTLRPELREEDYQERIDIEGVKREMLRMIPGVSLVAGGNYDSNSFLVNNSWAEAGVRATWNLVGLIQGPAAVAAAEQTVEITRQRQLATAVAVLTQIHLALAQFTQAQESFRTADTLNEIEGRLGDLAEAGSAGQVIPELERIRRAAVSVAAERDRAAALAALHAALGTLYVSIGVDPVPADLGTEARPTAEDLARVTEAVRASLAALNGGALPPLPEPDPAGAPDPARAKVAETPVRPPRTPAPTAAPQQGAVDPLAGAPPPPAPVPMLAASEGARR